MNWTKMVVIEIESKNGIYKLDQNVVKSLKLNKMEFKFEPKNGIYKFEPKWKEYHKYWTKRIHWNWAKKRICQNQAKKEFIGIGPKKNLFGPIIKNGYC